jgi:hypothetical protein
MQKLQEIKGLRFLQGITKQVMVVLATRRRVVSCLLNT